MSAEVERQRLLQRGQLAQIADITRSFELGEHDVRILDVCGMMLVVVQLEDAAGDVRFEGVVRVAELRQRVGAHVSG